ncbi:hypothetical protein KSS87_007171 [Heliosperma pusillum]|nr:hypothetical protein KSS87_007171 [Heliosperma pusillum]
MDTALFSPSSLFGNTSDNSSDEEAIDETHQNFVERTHQFPGMELIIREFSFHQLNANLLWPGTFAFVDWLVQHRSWIEGRRVIELGRHVNMVHQAVKFCAFLPLFCQNVLLMLDKTDRTLFLCICYSGTGALAIFLNKLLQLDITTSDYDDQEIEDNIAYNCRVNGVVPVLPHVKHTWGDTFMNSASNWDLIIASDILLWLPCPAFIMSWRRRIGKDDESLFFNGCQAAGLEVQHLGARVYCITSLSRHGGSE